MLRWLVLVGLFVLPLAVYWQTVFAEYGFRDDYAQLREAREEPGKLLKLVSAHGRPVFGLVLDASMRAVRSVPDLSWLRLASVALLAAVGVVLWLLLRGRGWSEGESAAIGAGVMLLPGAQVVVSWSITWPVALALLMAVLGFGLVESHLARGGAQRTLALAGGGVLYFLAGLTYQTSALFVVVPLAALLLVRSDGGTPGHVRWVAAHFGTLLAGLGAGFLLMRAVFSAGMVTEAIRMQLEPDPLLKLLWFFRQPLPNSIALLGLRDRLDTQPSFWIALASFGTVVALGYRYGARNRSQRLRWLFCALALPFVGHSASLAASTQGIGYRTFLPLSGLVLVLVVFAVRSVTRAAKLGPAAATAALCLLVGSAAILANRNSFTLMAAPQQREWQLVRSAAAAVTLEPATRIFIARPMIGDRSTERVYEDEFGSLSADAVWAAEEMFKAAMRERFPTGLPPGTAYDVDTGFVPPEEPSGYDLVLDMRTLRGMGDRAPAPAGEQQSRAGATSPR